MTGINRKLALALAIPIVFLALLCIYKEFKLMAGKKIVIPITGYDPRDLFSGHYITLRLNLEIGDACQGTDWDKDSISMCLSLDSENKVTGSHPIPPYSDEAEAGCGAIIRGRCDNGRFLAGIERFYVPENESDTLDRAVRSGEGSLVVSVDRNGKPAIKDLLVNGKQWREAVNDLKSRQ